MQVIRLTEMNKQDKKVLDMRWIFYVNNTLEDCMKEKINYIHSWNTTEDYMEDLKKEGVLARVKAYHFNMSLDLEKSSPMDHMDAYMVFDLYFDDAQGNYAVRITDREGIQYRIDIPNNLEGIIAEIKELEDKTKGLD